MLPTPAYIDWSINNAPTGFDDRRVRVNARSRFSSLRVPSSDGTQGVDAQLPQRRVLLGRPDDDAALRAPQICRDRSVVDPQTHLTTGFSERLQRERTDETEVDVDDPRIWRGCVTEVEEEVLSPRLRARERRTVEGRRFCREAPLR